MPMTFTPEMVTERLQAHGLNAAGAEPERRERLAAYVEEKFGDFVEGWEIRTGRPWNEMTRDEAAAMVQQHPRLSRNPGVLSRLMS